jgi:hypothetical protein
MRPATQADVTCLAAPRPDRRVLYFDIDGTLVQPPFGAAKAALADGAFERAVRAACFDRLVCVSDACLAARMALARGGGASSPWAALFRLCRGTFQDPAWFRLHVDAVTDPLHRAMAIDPCEDWFYVDDRASSYAAQAGLGSQDGCRRILTCRPSGDGSDVLRWLLGLARGAPVRPRRAALPPRDAPYPGPSSTPYAWRRV